MNKKKFKDTKVGAWINDKGPGILDSVLRVAGGSGIPAVSLIASTVHELLPDLKPEDKQVFNNLLHDYEETDYKEYLLDVQNARSREVLINNSEHSSWLVKNIVPMLAIAVVLLTIVLDLLVLTHSLNATENITFLVIGNANSLSTMILGYYFGTSKSSGAKDETIKKLIRA